MNAILIGFGVTACVLCVYALFAMLTFRRDRILDLVDGNGLAYLSLIVWMLVFIAGSAYLAFKGYDFDAATNLRRYVRSFTVTHFFEGMLCLFMTYGFSQLRGVKHGGKRTLIIAGGVLLGMLSILLGLSRLFAG